MINATTKEGREEFNKRFKPLTFEAFLKLKVGDTIYFAGGTTFFIYYPYKITSVKWCNSKDIDVFNSKGEYFKYKQITFEFCFGGGMIDRRYADSAGHNYGDLYIEKDSDAD